MRARRLAQLLDVVVVTAVLSLFACGASEEDCAKGTKLKNGVCVAETGAESNTAPRVDDLIVKRLEIAEEGQRPIYLLHPLNVTLGIEVKAQPFKSDVVVGFSSADGTKHCAAGYIELIHAGGADAGVDRSSETAKDAKVDPQQSNFGELTVTETLMVQPRCKNLIGEKNATVWIAIDPFRRLNIVGDKRLGGTPEPPSSIDGIDSWLHASRWPLNFCKSSYQSGHPGNCKSVVDVQKSPGLDVRMRRVQPSSSVVTVAELPTNTEDLEARDADLFVNVTTVTYGEEFKKIDTTDFMANDDNPLADLETSYFFMIKPDIAASDLPVGVSESDVDWEPLHVVEKGVVKAENGNATLQKLLQQFIASLETAVRFQLDVATLIPPDLNHKLRKGAWRRFSKYRLLGCVKAEFDEAKAAGLSPNNNCKIVPLIIAQHEYTKDTLVGAHHKKYSVQPGKTSADEVEFTWAEDPKHPANKCKNVDELRPRCAGINDHLKKTKCFDVPEYKVLALDGECHCCYPEDAFNPFLSFAHEPELGFTLGSNETVGIRTRVWWTLHLTNKSMFERQPLRVRSTVGFDATLVGWWRRGLLYVDTPIQLGIQPGQQSYWWPELGVLGFTLWDEKYVIDKDDPLFEIQQLAAKEWTQNFCQTFCVQIVCFDVCAQIGASVALQPGVQVNEKEKSITGQLKPVAAAIAGGSVGLNLFLGVVGIKVVFDKFIAFATPVLLEIQFVLQQLSDPVKVQINGKAEYRLELDVLSGGVSGFWTPKWGGGDQELELYEWSGLLYIWALWTEKESWDLEF